MKEKMLRIVALATLIASAVFAQDITGDWRGTLKPGQAELRLVLHIVKGDGGLKATMDSIDQGANGIPISSVTLKGTDLELTVDAVHGTYQGKVSADGGSIKGTWTQGQPIELNFERGAFKIAEHKPGKPSDIDGAWSGKLDFGAQTLRIVFHIVNTEDGLTATADSPDQGAKGMPVTSVTRDGASLKFEMKAAAASFDGKISADQATIAGTFTQRGTEVPLVLTRVKDADPAK
jgi:hypothetical protein